jgi:signal peptidase II
MRARWWPYAVPAGVAILDRGTKFLIESSVAEWEILPVIPGFFQIVHVRNTGMAFSMMAQPGRTSLPLVAFTAVVLALVGWMLWKAAKPASREHWAMRLALGLVFGGALGNLYDRVVLGSVTDFLDFYWGAWHFPAFNAADSAITAGAVLLILDLWLQRKRAGGSAPA